VIFIADSLGLEDSLNKTDRAWPGSGRPSRFSNASARLVSVGSAL